MYKKVTLFSIIALISLFVCCNYGYCQAKKTDDAKTVKEAIKKEYYTEEALFDIRDLILDNLHGDDYRKASKDNNLVKKTTLGDGIPLYNISFDNKKTKLKDCVEFRGYVFPIEYNGKIVGQILTDINAYNSWWIYNIDDLDWDVDKASKALKISKDQIVFIYENGEIRTFADKEFTKLYPVYTNRNIHLINKKIIESEKFLLACIEEGYDKPIVCDGPYSSEEGSGLEGLMHLIFVSLIIVLIVGLIIVFIYKMRNKFLER